VRAQTPRTPCETHSYRLTCTLCFHGLKNDTSLQWESIQFSAVAITKRDGTGAVIGMPR
jgi:hypothetical protein